MTTTTPSSTRTIYASASAPAQRQVGGWLAFFCFLLTAGSLVGGIRLILAWQEMVPVFEIYPGLRWLVLFDTLIWGALLLYTFSVGVSLWGGVDDGDVMARRYLKIRLLFVIVTVALISLGAGDLDGPVREQVNGEILRTLVGEGLFFVVWNSYFQRSKRVAATYGP